MKISKLTLLLLLFSFSPFLLFSQDSDNDGVDDAIDNCVNTPNADQSDLDNDGIGDACDLPGPSLVGMPSDITVECDAIPTPPNVTATSTCSPNTTVNFTENQMQGPCNSEFVLERVWTAFDDCGYFVTEIQLVTVIDSSTPVIFNVPNDMTVNCDQIPAPPNIGTEIMASDNCDVSPVIYLNEITVPGSCTDSYLLIREWTATDECGNYATVTQNITVEDTVTPTLSGVPADVTVSCDQIPAPATPSATDDCDVNVDITYDEQITPGYCMSNNILTRTWTATDNCGNTTTATQIVTVEDYESPILNSVPSDITLTCNDSIPTPYPVTATDNCSVNVTITVNDTTNGACPDTTIISRTWVATDECGNYTTGTQLIYIMPVNSNDIDQDGVDDNVDNCPNTPNPNQSDLDNDGIGDVCDLPGPTLIGVPADVTVACDQIPSPATVNATSNCSSNTTVSFTENIGTGCPYIIERIWTATDDCGHIDTAVQLVTVEDISEPILSGVPSDITVSCDAIPSPATPSATDNCDANVVITYNEQMTQGYCGSSNIFTRTWTATDNCGNTVTGTQTITTEDFESPIFIQVPFDVTVECDAIPTAPIIGVDIIAIDNCDYNPVITFTETIVPGSCANSYLLVREWMATDECGNYSFVNQNVTVEDFTAPTLDFVPSDITITCNDSIPTPYPVTATDNCSVNVTMAVNDTTTGACPDTTIISRVWIGTDECGNYTTGTQLIYIMPVNPNDSDQDGVDNNVDNCPNTPNPNQSDLDNDGIGDVCDLPGPTLIGVPADVTVACDQIPSPATVNATSNCSLNTTVSFTENIGTGCPYIIERIWTAIDDCGHIDTAVQLVTVEDVSEPILSGVPSDMTVSCDAIPPAPVIGSEIIATDNCDAQPVITFNEYITPGYCTGDDIITREWTATDQCGNTVTAMQVITTEDVVSPILTGVPFDITVSCDAIPQPDMPYAIDNCDVNPTVTFNEQITPGSCPGSDLITRIWTATDNCGNTTTEMQHITVEDITSPILTGVPADITLLCGDQVPPPATPSGVDNCSSNVTVTFNEVPNGSCPSGMTIDRIWTATDECGNQSTVVQIITLLPDTCSNPIYTDINADICEGESYTFGGQTYFNAGAYIDTLTTSEGCDSIVTLFLNVNPVFDTTVQVEICEGESYFAGGAPQTTAGVYQDVYYTVMGCDSIINTVLVIHPTYYENIVVDICEGEAYLFGGQVYTMTGTYQDVLTSTLGCDSIVTLNLMVHPIFDMIVQVEICEGESYYAGGAPQTTSGTYQDVHYTVMGCDSIVNTTLLVHPVDYTNLNANICEGEVYVFDGVPYTQTGTYTNTLTNLIGCDSIVTLNLTVDSAIVIYESATICMGDEYILGNTVYTLPGTYTETTGNGGCDSVIILTLDVLPSFIVNEFVQLCAGETYTFGSNTYYDSGVYTETFSAMNGCDSTVTLYLEFNQVYFDSVYASICTGETYEWLGNVYTQAGVYTETIQTTNGCDSLLELTLTIDGVDSDNDNFGNGCDNCPSIPNTDQMDSDGDGVGDVCDVCPNIPNADQIDIDGDGVGDLCDNCVQVPNPNQDNVNNCLADLDGDGVLDTSDNCPETPNADQMDADSDGLGDVCDNCPNIANANQGDIDQDGIGDLCDEDQDGDMVLDSLDNCPLTYNPNQEDQDLDGVGDACDNCVTVANTDQADTNNDGTGDVCTCDPNVAPLPTIAGFYQSAYASQSAGWTNYCTANGELLLSLALDNTGAVIPDNEVRLQIGNELTDFYAQDEGFITNENGGVIFNRRWEVIPLIQPTSNVGVRFYFRDAEFDAMNDHLDSLGMAVVPQVTDLNFYKVTNTSLGIFPDIPTIQASDVILIIPGAAPSTNSWILGNHGATDYYSEYEVYSFSGGGAGGSAGGGFLPVEMVSFTGKAIGKVNHLSWETASEDQNYGFEVERMNENGVWTKIGFVAGNGTTSKTKHYNFQDKSPLSNLNHYRLKQVDFDGKYTYSTIVVIYSEDLGNTISIYPNPAEDFINVTNGEGTGIIYNSFGQEMKRVQISDEITEINISDLDTGMYYIEFVNGNKRVTRRFYKVGE